MSIITPIFAAAFSLSHDPIDRAAAATHSHPIHVGPTVVTVLFFLWAFFMALRGFGFIVHFFKCVRELQPWRVLAWCIGKMLLSFAGAFVPVLAYNVLFAQGFFGRF